MVPSREAVSWSLAPAETLSSEDLLGGSPWDGRSRSRKRGATSSVETGQPVGLSFLENLDFFQSAASSLSPTRLLTESCAGVSPVSRVAPPAPTGELLPSPIPDGEGQPSLTLHRYGVGVDCHSRFFQVRVLIPNGTEIVKIERKVPALWPELRDAKAWLLHTLMEHGIAVSPSDLRYTCESTGQYHMPLCLAWRGRPAIINPSDTGHVRRKTDRLDAAKLAQHSLHGLWHESWMAPDEIQELRVLANQRSKPVAERSRLTNRINSDLLRFGHGVGQLGKINGSLVRALIEDFCANGSVTMHQDHFSDIRIPAGVVLVVDQRWKRVDAIDQEIKAIAKWCLKRVDELTWSIGAGRTAPGQQLRSNLQSIPGVGTQTVITWLGEIGDVTRF